jgi:FKBP-type peptidyl-prolyl cis-trans isomerase (trigger factor)
MKNNFFGNLNRQQKRALSKSEQIRSIEQLAGVIGKLRDEVQRLDGDVDTLMDLMSRKNLGVGALVSKGDAVSVGLIGRLYLEDGTLSEMPFQGGVAPQMLITSLVSGEMIAGFDEALVGQAVGSTVNFDVTFPADYREKSLAGKKANFEVVLHAAFSPSPTIDFVARRNQELIAKLLERQKNEAEARKAKEANAPNGDQAQSPS